jgi:Uncharacterised protein family (UPF0104).
LQRAPVFGKILPPDHRINLTLVTDINTSENYNPDPIAGIRYTYRPGSYLRTIRNGRGSTDHATAMSVYGIFVNFCHVLISDASPYHVILYGSMKNKLRTILGPAIVLVTVAAFVYYLKTHPETVDQIRSLPPLLILVLLGLYIVVFTALLILNIGQLMTYGKRMGWQENALFNAYSMLINFFGPGQSGPAFRGVYLKKKHDLGYKNICLLRLFTTRFTRF